MSLLAIALATFVSEDLTCIATGLLIAQGKVDAVTGLVGCYVGILGGDIGLWLLGRFGGRRVLRWRFVERRLPAHRLESLSRWFARRGWQAVFAARFVPGTRLPVYVGAGMLGANAGNFLLWAAAACLLWTPLLVGAVAWIGEPIATPLQTYFGTGWMALLIAVALLFAAYRVLMALSTSFGRASLIASVSRIWRWEFWPAWLFYIPLMPWLVYLALRHKGPTAFTAVNPAIPHGGVVGESKYEILSRLPRGWIVPTEFIAPGDVEARRETLRVAIDRNGWSFPLILKPDVGERGAGLKLARTIEEGYDYLERNVPAVVVQTYHPGPFEAGVFYYRFPQESTGHIFSITDKRFPVLTGDGVSTIEALIRRHPRFSMQASKFLARLNGRAESVLSKGERLPLAVAGNHCQGTEFRDGGHLITTVLAGRIDEIARSFEGFYFGRFDVRYTDAEAFRAGRDFAIVELNGAASESTNLYDPSKSLLEAYRILFRQWRILYAIGAANRDQGYRVTPALELMRTVGHYYRTRTTVLSSD